MAKLEELIAELESYCETGSNILLEYRDIAREFVSPRLFKGEELLSLVGVANLTTIYRAEKEGRIQAAEKDAQNRRLGSTLAQVVEMQHYFRSTPGRKPGDPPVVLSFTNFKGGCWKTTTGWYASSYFANMGLKVLMVDLDPQASLTKFMGIMPDLETSHETSLGPEILREEDAPPTSSLVRSTYCTNIDIIPSTLDLAGVEYALANAIVEARNSPAESVEKIIYWFNRVRSCIAEVKDDYDIVIIDGTPSVGLIPINIVFGSDEIVVPVPTEAADYASTISFCSLFSSQLQTIADVLGETNDELPNVKFLPTRFSPSERTATTGSELVLQDIRRTFSANSFRTVIKKHDAVVSNLGPYNRTIFDVNAGDLKINRAARKRAMENYSAVFQEVLERCVYPRWPSKVAELRAKGVY